VGILVAWLQNRCVYANLIASGGNSKSGLLGRLIDSEAKLLGMGGLLKRGLSLSRSLSMSQVSDSVPPGAVKGDVEMARGDDWEPPPPASNSVGGSGGGKPQSKLLARKEAAQAFTPKATLTGAPKMSTATATAKMGTSMDEGGGKVAARWSSTGVEDRPDEFARQLSVEELSKADFFFSLTDEAGAGVLTSEQVKFALAMMGLESASVEVSSMLAKLPSPNKITASEFRLIVAMAPMGFMTAGMDEIDQERLETITKVTSKDSGLHPGYAELADFLRALKGGIAVHRIDAAGNSCPLHLGLTKSLDGMQLRHGPMLKTKCNLTFSSLRAVSAPFHSESKDEAGASLLSHEHGKNSHARTLILVFAIKADEGLPATFTGLTAWEEAANAGKRRRSKLVEATSKAALALASDLLADPEQKQSAGHEHDESVETIKVRVPKGAKPGETAEFTLAGGQQIKVTIPKNTRAGQRIPVKVPSSKLHPKTTAAAPGQGFLRVRTKEAYYNLLGGLTAIEPLDGIGSENLPPHIKEALAFPRARGYSMGVLVVTLARMGARDRMLGGLPVAAQYIDEHVMMARKRKGHVAYGVSRKRLSKQSSLTSMPRGKEMEDEAQDWSLFSCLNVLKYIYRPHHETHSYIPARYSLGTIAEVTHFFAFTCPCTSPCHSYILCAGSLSRFRTRRITI